MIELAAAALGRGACVVLPTDTVYGLCANPFREDAVRRLAALKGRPEGTPCAVVAADLDALLELAAGARPFEDALRLLLPGPYTLVVPDPEELFGLLGGRGTVGIRVVDLPGEATAIVRRVDVVAATSANRHGGPDPRRVEDVPAEIRDACAAVVDAGPVPGVPSTVIDLTGTHPAVLRAGAGDVERALSLLRPGPGTGQTPQA